jgi:hypothetical protein
MRKVNNISKRENVITTPLPLTLKMAICFLIGHGACVLIVAVHYIYFSGGDFSELDRALLRIFGVLITSYLLSKRSKVGFWCGVCVLGMLSFLFLSTIILLFIVFLNSNLSSLYEVYPLSTIILMGFSGINLLMTFIFLMHPKSREVF